MVRFGTRSRGRAMKCWGLNFGPDDMHSAVANWLELSPDAFVFPRDDGGSESCREVMLAHGARALAASVSHAVAGTRHSAAEREIANRLTTMSLDEALEVGAAIHGDWYVAPGTLFTLLPRRAARSDRGLDLAAIDVLDAFVAALRDRRPLPSDALGLTHIAFHAALNPVCLCSAAYAFGEVLTVAAWLGMAYRGRDVVMPEFIAAYWLMLLGAEGSGEASPAWEPDVFLMRQAKATFGQDGLREACEATLRTGPVVLRRRAFTRIRRSATPAPVPELTAAALWS